MPMSVGDIDRFEKLNEDLTINVYGYEEGILFPRRISEMRGEKPINLIIYDNLKEVYHYALIKNLDRLLGSGDTEPEEILSILMSWVHTNQVETR